MLPQDTTHLIQRPCYQHGSPCQDPAGNRTTRRPPDHCKNTPTAVEWSCLPFIESGQNHLVSHNERGKKTRQTGRGGKTTTGNGQAWSSPSPGGQWRTGKGRGNWLRNHLWCPNDPRGQGIDGDDDWAMNINLVLPVNTIFGDFDMSCGVFTTAELYSLSNLSFDHVRALCGL